MGKKKFINKKKSATFTLVYRESAAEDDPSDPNRQFTRVDGGDSYVPGFSQDDPRSHTGYDHGEFGEEDEEVSDGEESKFADADEDTDDVEVPELPPKRISDVVRRRTDRLPENVRRELIELGFPDDGYDYNQHMRRMGATGVVAAFVPSTRGGDPLHPDVKAYDASKVDVEAVEEGAETAADEIIELVSSRTRLVRKPLSKSGVLDADILAALENSDGSQFDSADELEDEFVVFASEGVAERASTVVVDGATASGRFQEGAARRNQTQPEESSDGDSDYFEDDGQSQELPGSANRERATRLLDERFEKLALNEYDDFEIGDLEENNLTRGRADISQFSSVLSEFLNDRDIYAEKYETIADSSRSDPALECTSTFRDSNSLGGKASNTNMVANKGLDDLVVKKTLELGRHESESELVALVESEEDTDKWDCETVVSTYSNLDNHPGKISTPGRSKLRPKLQDLEKAKIIRLGGKQHLPLDYLPGKLVEAKKETKAVDRDASSVGKVAGPRAGETLEEKKARKASIKEHRREARLAKKTLKTRYREESFRAQHGAATMGPNAIHLP